MTCRGPFQPKTFYDSMILWFYPSHSEGRITTGVPKCPYELSDYPGWVWPPYWATSSRSQPYIKHLEIGYIISDYFWEFFVHVKSYFKLCAKNTEIHNISHKVQRTFLAKTPLVFSKEAVNGAQWMEKENKIKAGKENIKIYELPYEQVRQKLQIVFAIGQR